MAARREKGAGVEEDVRGRFAGPNRPSVGTVLGLRPITLTLVLRAGAEEPAQGREVFRDSSAVARPTPALSPKLRKAGEPGA